MDKEREADLGDGGGAEETPQAPLREVNPWRDIFFRPRLTTRWLLAHETAVTALTMWLALTALFVVSLFLTIMFSPGTLGSEVTKIHLVVFTPLIFILSWVYFVVGSYVLWGISRLLGGQAEAWQMRVVNSFTTVIPAVVLGLLRLGLVFLFGRGGLAGMVIDNIMMIWTVYITLSAIAEAAAIAPWRALVTYLASVGVVVGAVAGVAGVLRAVAG